MCFSSKRESNTVYRLWQKSSHFYVSLFIFPGSGTWLHPRTFIIHMIHTSFIFQFTSFCFKNFFLTIPLTDLLLPWSFPIKIYKRPKEKHTFTNITEFFSTCESTQVLVVVAAWVVKLLKLTLSHSTHECNSTPSCRFSASEMMRIMISFIYLLGTFYLESNQLNSGNALITVCFLKHSV